MANDRTDIPPGTLDMLILKTLARCGPLHGYGIAKYIKAWSQEVLQVEEGSLYPALQRMLMKGWIAGKWGQTDRKKRARFYTLTPAGRDRMASEISEFNRVVGAIGRVIEPA